MFVLRRITSEGLQTNESIGDHYNYVDAELNPKEFKEGMDQMKWVKDPNIYGFVVFNNGSQLRALYKNSTYFVMCSNGQTFANITHR